MQSIQLKNRGHSHHKEDGTPADQDVSTKELAAEAEFRHRESPLTTLIAESPHIRAVYHIFVVILILLFFDTVTHDLIERGELNVGLEAVIKAFGDPGRALGLWLWQLVCALLFYLGLTLYECGSRILATHGSKHLLEAWKVAGVCGMVCLQAGLLLVPIVSVYQRHLALASSAAVLCEMFRHSMKLHSAFVTLGPRASSRSSPLPSLTHYIYFLFAPTLIYRDSYPRTKKIRWLFVMQHLLEVAMVIFYDSFLWNRLILPQWSDYGKQPTVELSRVVRGMFACVLPGIISFLCGHYCLLHAWLNAWAEMLTFADRAFYEPWWTTCQYDRYFRAWNLVVHVWLRDHVYRPLRLRLGRHTAAGLVFLLSAVAHELVLALAFGFCYPVLMVIFSLVGIVITPLTNRYGKAYPRVSNILLWLSMFIGNGLLWGAYSMEYFARKNCPSSPGDKYYKPKSWSCPMIVVNPSWRFKNPFTPPINQ